MGAKMKISLKDIEAVLEAISATKKLLKPLAATQDELNQRIKKIDDDLEDDRVELLSPSIIKKIELISEHAAKQVEKMPVEQADVAVRCTLLSEELQKRDLSEFKINRIVRLMDLDGDGKISLDEMESYMKQVKLYMKDKKYDADTDKILNIMSGKMAEATPKPNVNSSKSEEQPLSQ